MSVKINPPSFRYISLTELADQTRGVQNAHLLHEQGITDLQQAMAALKTQVAALNSTTTTGTGTSTTVISENVTASGFVGLGTVNDQTGNVAYTVQGSDNGALIVVSDASSVAITLNSNVLTPFFFFLTNLGAGTATLTPTSGLVNGAASLPIDNTAIVVFNGTNWFSTELPVVPTNTPIVLHKWLNSYNSTTGLFTQTQPDYSDLTGTPQLAQTFVAVVHKWLNSFNAVTGLFTAAQPTASDVSGLGTAATQNTTGAGVAIPTGPTVSVSGDLVTFTGTAGQIADSGTLLSNIAKVNVTNTFSASQIFTGSFSNNSALSAVTIGVVSAAVALIEMTLSTAPTDQKLIDLENDGTGFSVVFTNDTNTLAPTVFKISRSGNSATLATFACPIAVTSPQTTVSASGSGTVIFSQPEQGSSFKKVLIYLNAATGTASYTFPAAFAQTPGIVATSVAAAGVVTALSTTAVTVTGSPTTGFIELIGF
jgi:hypothetical protein